MVGDKKLKTENRDTHLKLMHGHKMRSTTQDSNGFATRTLVVHSGATKFLVWAKFRSLHPVCPMLEFGLREQTL